MAVSRSKGADVNISECVAHVQATFNNTIITITKQSGDTLCQSTPGMCGFKGARRGTPGAAQEAAAKAANMAKERGVKTVSVELSGAGAGRDSAIRALNDVLNVTSLIDKTPIPHNGCRPRKKRRV